MDTKILIAAISLLALASCGRSEMSMETPQERIDSMVNAKVAHIRSQMEAKNDSIINVLARKEADSIVKAAHDEAIIDASKPKPPADTRPGVNRQDTTKKAITK